MYIEKSREKSQRIVGCNQRVGNSLGSVSKITEVGLAEKKEKIKRLQYIKKVHTCYQQCRSARVTANII